MKVLIFIVLQLVGSQILFASDCFPEAVKPGVYLNNQPGTEGGGLLHVIEIEGCWIKGYQCSVPYGEKEYSCSVEKEAWVNIKDIPPFHIQQEIIQPENKE